jgi:hypothetical protein
MLRGQGHTIPISGVIAPRCSGLRVSTVGARRWEETPFSGQVGVFSNHRGDVLQADLRGIELGLTIYPCCCQWYLAEC